MKLSVYNQITLFVILLLFFSVGLLQASAKSRSTPIPFGRKGQIIYNLDNGTVDVKVGTIPLITAAYAEASNGDHIISSKDYQQRRLSTQPLEDALGKGTEVRVVLYAKSLPTMIQTFFVYDDLNYFFTELHLEGAHLKSNYMAPLISQRVDLGVRNDNRILFVPFDNDTFIRYEAKSLKESVDNTSSEVTAFFDNSSRTGLVMGSVDHSVWKTGIQTRGSGAILHSLKVWAGYTDPEVTRDSIAHGNLHGDTLKSPRIFVGLFDDWRDGLDQYARVNKILQSRHIFKWDKPTPFGWNSWGAMQQEINLEKAKRVVDFFTDSIPSFRNGETAYIDLDSYWDNLIQGGLEGDFSQLDEFVRYCKSQGLKPGVYWAPFVDWIKTDRRVEGSQYSYTEAWTKVNGNYHDLDGTRAMDPTHPATLRRIDLVIDKFKKSGFEMIKIDFIGHAAIEADSFFDPTVSTGMAAFNKGMEYLIDRLDGEMLVYAAISPNLATAPYVHMRRIACDAYADIHASEYTLNSSTFGWWQRQLYDYVDADHLVFGNEPLAVNRARLTSGIVNGTLILGDDFSREGSWTVQAKSLLKNQEILDLARQDLAFRPLEGNVGEGAAEVFVAVRHNSYFLAVVNYTEGKEYKLEFNRLGFPESNYVLKELYSHSTSSSKGKTLQIYVPGQDAVIYKISRKK